MNSKILIHQPLLGTELRPGKLRGPVYRGTVNLGFTVKWVTKDIKNSPQNINFHLFRISPLSTLLAQYVCMLLLKCLRSRFEITNWEYITIKGYLFHCKYKSHSGGKKKWLNIIGRRLWQAHWPQLWFYSYSPVKNLKLLTSYMTQKLFLISSKYNYSYLLSDPSLNINMHISVIHDLKYWI